MANSKSVSGSPSNVSTAATSKKSSESISPPAFKPTPIIGPDGREIPRPRDAEGRPLPIYSTEDGKPYLDKAGRPIVVMFDEDGKPLPPPPTLEPPTPPLVVPNWVVGFGIVDMFICLIVAGVAGFFLTKGPTEPERICLIVTMVLAAIGAVADVFPFLAMKKKSKTYLYAWIGVAILLLIGQAGVTIFSHPPAAIGASIHCLVRAVLIFCIYCGVYALDGGGQDEKVMRYDRQAPPGGYPNYPRQQQAPGQQGNPTLLVQQPQTVVVAAPPPPMYGYGYPGFGYGGFANGGYPYGGYYGGDLAMMAMMSHHHHGFGYGFDGGFFM